MIGTKIYKTDISSYPQVAKWCNENNAHIEDMGNYYEVVANPIYVPTQEEIKKAMTDGVQKWMDSVAQTRGYDNIHTACSYVNSTDEIFAREGKACLQWRDVVWRTCYNILDEVMAGEREIPTLEELIEELPKLDWGDSVVEETTQEETAEEGGTE